MAKAAKKAKRKRVTIVTWASVYAQHKVPFVVLSSTRREARFDARNLRSSHLFGPSRVARVRITEL